MSYTWHLHGIHKALTCNTHVMPMAYTWPRVHMALTWNAHKTHVEYPWNALCMHMEYTWHVIHMVCTWDTTTMIHIAYLCTWHTHTRIACMECTWSVHLAYIQYACITHGITWQWQWHTSPATHACITCIACHLFHKYFSVSKRLLIVGPSFAFGHVERIVVGSSFGHDFRNWRRWRLPRPR